MIILAIVIIIALITASILGQFPGIGASTRSRGSTAYWQSSEVGIIGYSIANDGNDDDLVMNLRNNRKDTITVTDIKFDGTTVYGISTVIAPGETETITNDSIGNICNKAGDAFAVGITIVYTDEETGTEFSFTGAGSKLEGKCAN